MSKTYATVKCCCRRVKSVPVSRKRRMVKCDCGARLWLNKISNDEIVPAAQVRNDYPHKDKAPDVTGWYWRSGPDWSNVK